MIGIEQTLCTESVDCKSVILFRMSVVVTITSSTFDSICVLVLRMVFTLEHKLVQEARYERLVTVFKIVFTVEQRLVQLDKNDSPVTVD